MLYYVVFFFIPGFGCKILYNTLEFYNVLIVRRCVFFTDYRVLVLLGIQIIPENVKKNIYFCWYSDEL